MITKNGVTFVISDQIQGTIEDIFKELLAKLSLKGQESEWVLTNRLNQIKKKSSR